MAAAPIPWGNLLREITDKVLGKCAKLGDMPPGIMALFSARAWLGSA
jgi:hypothetical protein